MGYSIDDPTQFLTPLKTADTKKAPSIPSGSYGTTTGTMLAVAPNLAYDGGLSFGGIVDGVSNIFGNALSFPASGEGYPSGVAETTSVLVDGGGTTNLPSLSLMTSSLMDMFGLGGVESPVAQPVASVGVSANGFSMATIALLLGGAGAVYLVAKG